MLDFSIFLTAKQVKRIKSTFFSSHLKDEGSFAGNQCSSRKTGEM